jgi:hypothetical protein
MKHAWLPAWLPACQAACLATAMLCAAAPSGAEPVLPYAPAVAQRFGPPAVLYDTPGLAPGRDRWTDNTELDGELQAMAASGAARLLNVGRSESGQAILALHFQRGPSPGAASAPPATEATPPRPLALLVGQQHGNEPAGAEALLVTARRLADPASPLSQVLAQLDVIVLPRLNPDGAMLARRGNGPGLDINRDHLRLQSAEARALAALVRQWRPVLVVDLHEYRVMNRYMPRFGGLKGHDLLWQAASAPNLPADLSSAAEALFAAPLKRDMAAAGLSLDRYFTNPRADTGLQLTMGGLQPDLARNAYGLRHAVSILLESRGLDLQRLHAQRRVHTHVVALGSLLRSAAQHAAELKALQSRLDEQVADLACTGQVVLSAAPARSWRPLVLIDAETGEDKTVLVDWGSALDLVPLASRARPCGYWLAADAGEAVQRLHQLGVEVRTILAGQRLQGQRYREQAAADPPEPDDLDPSSRLRRISVSLEPDSFEPPEGSFYVPLNQPRAHLVVAALEPDAPSSWFAHGIVPRLSMVQRVTTPP